MDFLRPLLFLVASLFVAMTTSAATITLNSVQGVSRYEQGTTTSGTVSTNSYNIFAGFAYDSTSGATYNCSTNGTCNTCVGGLQACNRDSAIYTNNVTFNLSVDTVTTNATWKACSGANSTTDLLLSGTATSNGTGLTWVIPWSTLCSASGLGTDCTASEFTNGTISFAYGTESNCTGTQATKIDVKVYIHYKITSGATQSVASKPPSTADGTYANSFKVFPGDEKVYLLDDNFGYWTGFPKAGSAASFNFTHLVFFYAPIAGTAGPDATIANNSDSKEISLTSDGLAEKNYIDGLTNNVRYCFRMANKDATGVISFFTPDGLLATADICNTPQEVVGLLADKKCFIATAAYGSDLDPRVTSFRKFRNEYLIPHPWGRALVRTYYKYSPAAAAVIQKHEWLRTTSRILLWPVLWIVELSLAVQS